jgi:hypothetical protein
VSPIVASPSFEAMTTATRPVLLESVSVISEGVVACPPSGYE